MRLRFAKMSGAGNDFILLSQKPKRSLPALARRLCDRSVGIGADGLLLVERKPILKLSYFNADGSPAFCGNGSRCAAWWMRRQGWTGNRRKFSFSTSAGPLLAQVNGPNEIAIRMPTPKVLALGLRLKILGRKLEAHWIDTGSAHAVVPVKSVEQLPVLELGRAVRHHKAFGRQGVNADFVAFNSKGLTVRTYERGVEAETLACGTGAVAAALAAYLSGRAKPPVAVLVKSGQTLRVHFTPVGESFEDVWLEGPARLIFEGEINL